MEQAATVKILIVDDTPLNLQLLMGILTTEEHYEIYQASSGELALRFVQDLMPDLILLDIKMPGMDGFSVCKRLKADERTRDIPVIFISALDAIEDKVKSFQVGGVDYISKPVRPPEVLARVKTHLTMRRLQQELQHANTKLAQQLREAERLNEELQHRNKELEHAHGTIKTLSGLVPICAWCHQSIRDESDHWMKLETYIEGHSEAKFTHGICPSCAKKLQGDRDE